MWAPTGRPHCATIERIPAIECQTPFTYVFDELKFRAKKTPSALEVETEPAYRSYFNCFCSTFGDEPYVYDRTDTNYVNALGRLFAQMDDDRLRPNNEEWLRSRRVKRFLEALSKEIQERTMNDKDLCAAVEDYARAPHPKRKLREAHLAELRSEGQVVHDCGGIESVKVKMKPNERAKQGKKPRSIVDLGRGNLLTGRVLELAKAALMSLNGDRYDFHYCKEATYDGVKGAFSFLLESPRPLRCIAFSDDACCTLQCADGDFRFNLDIKNCDNTHSYGFLRALGNLDVGVGATQWKAAFRQLTLPFKLKTRRDRLTVKQMEATLMSGSVTTTFVNTCAVALMWLRISQAHRGSYTRSEVRELLPGWCRQAGYEVTIEACQCMEELQFLKNSPGMTDEGLEIYQNLGVLLRTSGVYKHDVPGRGSLQDRARAAQAGLIGSFKHHGQSCVWRALAAKWGVADADYTHRYWQQAQCGPERVTPDWHLARRYSLPESAFQELAAEVRCAPPGFRHKSATVWRVLQADYGAKPREGPFWTLTRTGRDSLSVRGETL